MSTILGWLGTIKLSIQQIAALSVAALVGGLVLALKLQGTELHKAQVQLLETSFKAAQDKHDTAVDAARDAFNKAKADYYDAGGV